MTDDTKPKEQRKPLKFVGSFSFWTTIGIVGVWVVFQIILMSAYIYLGQGRNLTADDYLNRWSWTDAQALGLAALVVAVYAVWRQECYMWLKFGIRMKLRNNATDPSQPEEVEELQLEKLTEVLIPLQKILFAFEEKLKERNIKTDDVVILIEKLFKYEKDIAKWTERMEKIYPILDVLAESATKIEPKILGRVIGYQVAKFAMENKEVKKID